MSPLSPEGIRTEPRFAAVLVDAGGPAARRPFDYLIPDHLLGLVRPGSLVVVPFGRRFLRGLVTALVESAAVPDPKAIRELYPVSHLADRHAPQLAAMLSSRYACSPIEAYRAILPAAVAGQTARVWSLGPAPAPEPGAVRPEFEAVYGFVRERGDVGLGQVTRALGLDKRAALERLGWLAARGWLSPAPRFERAPQSAESLLFAANEVAATAELPRLGRRAPVQAAVLRALLAAGIPLPESDLPVSAGRRRAVLVQLESRGLVTRSAAAHRVPGGGIVSGIFAPGDPLPPGPHQAAALAEIVPAVIAGIHRQYLLFGVTGSGKTEVYLQAIAAALARGRQALVLVPEIALTPQAVTRFEARFPGRVALIHSRLAAGERAQAWRDLAAGRAAIALGPRSAVFAPLPALGLIVVDEEHDPSYKNNEAPRYDARQVARHRARLAGAPVIFGTATPSVEAFHAADSAPGGAGGAGEAGDAGGNVRLLEMPERVDGRLLPQVELIDMRAELAAGNRSIFSRRLQAALADRLGRSEQTILFLNRRGLATFVLCRECGYVARCPQCDVSLVYHRQDSALRCHYCGHREPVPEVCPACRSRRIRHFGAGTERVEAEVRATFPDSRVARLDLDVAMRRDAVRDILSDFARGSIDVLVGTQMIGKGLDVPGVTLVGVVAADTALAFPDFRAGERTFSLVTQVSGRAGRGSAPGLVVVQTYCPDHYSLLSARTHDYRGFYRAEIEFRRELGYPPFSALGIVRLDGAVEATVSRAAATAADELATLAKSEAPGLELLGPAPAPLPRLQGRYRWNIVLKDSDPLRLAALASRVVDRLEGRLPSGVRVSVDIEPQEML
ncbi:MAG: primosomal protein N' [Bacillota bacterium]|nr:primosomal protein N' [Bacillota bacterium]